jgi:hypothetical protein
MDFINILFGHLVGDYILQNKHMARNKSIDSSICLLHCFFYTMSMIIFTRIHNPYWISIVFISHFIIDRFSLAEKWLKLIDGRSLNGYLQENYSSLNYNILTGSFAAVVYTVVDNTFHLMIQYYSYQWVQ